VAQAEHTAWSLFRHADVSRALLDPATYSSAVSAHLAVPSGIDPPEHTDYRLIIDRYFAPDRMAAVEPKLRAIAVEMLSGLPADGEVEFVSHLAESFRAASAMRIPRLAGGPSRTTASLDAQKSRCDSEQEPRGYGRSGLRIRSLYT
jgi:cytochrome P450